MTASAPFDLTHAKRDQLRALQDRFLKSARVKKFCDTFGYTWELFGPGSPSFRDLEKFVEPAYENRIKEFLGED